jgi:hypothetical protein
MANFDQAVVDRGSGPERLTHDQFFKLPLMERVKMLTDRKVQFFKAGRPVPMADAMK